MAKKLTAQIDEEGYRPNVGIIMLNDLGEVFWAKRRNQNAWQFPQGGIKPNEAPEDAMYRELKEEAGLDPQHIEILGRTADWLRYELPENYIRHHSHPVCIGQKQIWFLIRLVAGMKHINLHHSDKPEFDDWKWVHYQFPISEVVDFKRDVYQKALEELRAFC